jgi:hypothetical protein
LARVQHTSNQPKRKKKKTAGKTREEEEEPHSPKSPALQMAMSTLKQKRKKQTLHPSFARTWDKIRSARVKG